MHLRSLESKGVLEFAYMRQEGAVTPLGNICGGNCWCVSESDGHAK